MREEEQAIQAEGAEQGKGQDSEALMKSVKLLQALGQHYNHLQEQPQKALVDILSQVWAQQLWSLG